MLVNPFARRAEANVRTNVLPTPCPCRSPQQVDGVEFRVVVVEFLPDLPSSRKAEDAFFIFGYKDRDVASQNLFLPAMRPVLFVQGGEEDVADDAGVSRLPALDVYVRNRGCVLDVSSSDREIHRLSAPAVAR
jgi:hypothetical protein